jgi:hypothetical protein
MKPMGRVLRGVGAAIRARPRIFVGAAAGMALLNLLLPPLVLSLSRKPVDYFTFNPWLKRLPEFLASGAVPIEKKLDFLPRLALFWFSADGSYGPEWGFAVDVTDLARVLATGLLVGAYLVVWLHQRDQLTRPGWDIRLGRQGGAAGAVTTILGLSTSPCSVVGCGAPVIPVVGLAFVGLQSGTLALLAAVSRVATSLVLLGLTVGVAYLGWLTGAPPPPPGGRDRTGGRAPLRVS